MGIGRRRDQDKKCVKEIEDDGKRQIYIWKLEKREGVTARTRENAVSGERGVENQ